MAKHIIVKYKVSDNMDEMIHLARMQDDGLKILRADAQDGFIIYILRDRWSLCRFIKGYIKDGINKIKSLWRI